MLRFPHWFILFRHFNRYHKVWWKFIRINSTRVKNWFWWWIWIIHWSMLPRSPANVLLMRYRILVRSGNTVLSSCLLWSIYPYKNGSSINSSIYVYHFHQNMFRVAMENSTPYHVRIRPYSKEFLKKMSKLYELNIFTFATRPYARVVAGNSLDLKTRTFVMRIIVILFCW